jgi:hypothetical protein
MRLRFFHTPDKLLVMPKNILHVQKHWLVLARVGWIVIVVLAYALSIATIPSYFASLQHLRSSPGSSFTVQLTPADVHTLHTWGLSLNFYAAAMVFSSLLFQMCYAVTGVVLFWRRSGDWAVLQASFALMLLPFAFAAITMQTLPPNWLWLIPVLGALGNASLRSCAYVFPDGRFVPRWSRWLALALFAYWAMVAVFPSWQVDRSLFSLTLFVGFSLSALAAQLYRYRYVSTLRQRQQTRWVLFGVIIAVMSNTLPRLLYAFVLSPLLHGGPLAFALEINLTMYPLLALPITIGIAILSSHLWDIDVVINRTLVYGTLSTTLALIYLILVFGLQSLLHGLLLHTADSGVAIFSSTLAVAVLFQPLRHRLQRVIDQRFYRRKYDAARTLAALSATLRNEVDLSQLREQLQAVVEETMQPTHVSLWFRTAKPPTKRKPGTGDLFV